MCTTEKKRIVLYSEEPQRLRKKNYAYYHRVLVHNIQRSYNILHTIGTSKLDCCETTTCMYATLGKAPETNVFTLRVCIII